MFKKRKRKIVEHIAVCDICGSESEVLHENGSCAQNEELEKQGWFIRHISWYSVTQICSRCAQKLTELKGDRKC